MKKKVFVTILILIVMGILLIITVNENGRKEKAINTKAKNFEIIGGLPLEGKKLLVSYIEKLQKSTPKFNYLLLFIYRDGDCTACISDEIPVIYKESIKTKIPVLALFASEDTIQEKRIAQMFHINNPIYQQIGLVNLLHLEKTPAVLLVNQVGDIVYGYYPNYLSGSERLKFYQQVEALSGH